MKTKKYVKFKFFKLLKDLEAKNNNSQLIFTKLIGARGNVSPLPLILTRPCLSLKYEEIFSKIPQISRDFGMYLRCAMDDCEITLAGCANIRAGIVFS